MLTRTKVVSLPFQAVDPKAPAQAVDPNPMELPAVFVNCFQLTMLGNSLVRLSLGEQTSAQSTPVYRTAVLLAVDDARQFCQQILTAVSSTQGRPT
jgi:hypothetical protein